MTAVLVVPLPDLRALATGEAIVAFLPAGPPSPGDEVELESGGARSPTKLKPAYRGWAEIDAPPGRWSARVEAVHPVEDLDPKAADARHVLASLPEEGLVLVLRVEGPEGPVLSDAAFAGRLRSLRSALR